LSCPSRAANALHQQQSELTETPLARISP